MGPWVLQSRLNKEHPNLVAFQDKQGDYGPTLYVYSNLYVGFQVSMR